MIRRFLVVEKVKEKILEILIQLTLSDLVADGQTDTSKRIAWKT
ncbi:MAG: hypothetical protein O4861_05760 [Trichodesmium sp. St16_bin4-tuft]|nr:hypothetical protein [Trichodesmium sp. St4_bin8_1]MDE5072061.1 hypothetical protein [Trichodesmium sp. St5_bin8]MDE5076860.1 hypothetical protein [Trichodesmium sp. St2_bin6]MDE5090482.1 hypothetical protein [Trichodesmium sp. St18_bin3_1_1]MDE5097870.1 hypothetical protein [Trichodesmium sp. St16_bin4-tuft]MDE5105288.1 hypothetical protein [Trichodesmium sp. St19_bin2]